MSEVRRQFEVVQDEPPASQGPDPATRALLLALKALSQRTIIALASLFTLTTVALVFWATISILPQPTVHQLVGVGIFAVFTIIINWLVRRT